MRNSKHTADIRFPWRKGNRYELLINGEHFFSDILASMEQAVDYIFVELYLFESGRVADEFISTLRSAAGRGVRIYVLLDDYGSLGLSEQDRARLQRDPVQLAYYNPLTSRNMWRNLYRILWHRVGYDLHRDHRKLILIDGLVAYVGGLGITDEFYSGEQPERCWRENVVRIEGPVVADWQELFQQVWNRYTLRDNHFEKPMSKVLHEGGHARVVFSDGTADNDIKRQLRKRLTNAERRIWLCTAYFLPSWRFLRRLRRAARNGLDVRLLLPGPRTDHPVVRHAGRRHYYRMLRNGVRIFEYQPRVLHAKSLLCDDWVTLGSNNFDHWGLNWNLEANLEVEDCDFAEQVEQMFEQDFTHSIEITEETWHQRTTYERLAEWFWGRVDRLVIAVTNRLRR